MSRLEAAIAASRFGMGARPGEIADAASDPRGWLASHIRRDAAIIPAAGLKSAREVLDQRRESGAAASEAMQMQRPEDPAGSRELSEAQRKAIQQRLQEELRNGLMLEANARSSFAAVTPHSFAERWARFWANHFTVSARGVEMLGLVGPFEREAVRPFVFSDFRTLLQNAILHPGMLVYLDAFRSIGPSTRQAQRRGAGLNENLAREALELHTVGAGTGYTQADVIELAKALTGWTLPARRPGRELAGGDAAGQGGAIFVPALHEPGTRTVLGRPYPDDGAEQARAILSDLAGRPETARHVAVKLARHFVADEPPASAIERLERRFLETDGDLAELARAVIALDDAWSPEAQKFKTPDELLVSAARGSDHVIAYGRDRRAVYTSLGQPPYGAPSPAGWPDSAEYWAGPDAIKKRLEWANAAAVRVPGGQGAPMAFLETALGPLADARAREAVARAESARQAWTLALMSPAFQRR
jgi:uncharacterized protein (DUF1800 family)